MLKLIGRKKFISKAWKEVAASDQSKRCPFLKPFETTDSRGTVKYIEQECLRQRCMIWNFEEENCSIPVIANVIKKLRRKKSL